MTTTIDTRTTGTVTVHINTNDQWNIALATREGEDGIEYLNIKLTTISGEECPPPQMSVNHAFPMTGAFHRWAMGAETGGIPAGWAGGWMSMLPHNAPVYAVYDNTDGNRFTAACSETALCLNGTCGVREEGCLIEWRWDFFNTTEAPRSHYEATLRFDPRPLPFTQTLQEASRWFTSPEIGGIPPCTPPADAWEPLYSTWYGFHQSLFDKELEEEFAIAAREGMKVLIVDDGWQTEDTNRGYAFCGDWEMCKSRFPDMRAHVDRVHAMGLKYMLWYSVPFVGYKSKNYETFKGKYLYNMDWLKTSVLDPRFPEVREFLVGTYEKALREWDLDGFKLDFVDRFCFQGTDPAIAENYAGRDIRSLSDAVEKLFAEIRARLDAIKPNLLYEFRQPYVGPRIRAFGNMLRAGDCPASIHQNRARITGLRLLSEGTAVHADMLEWNPAECVERAALQVLACLFGVIQYSMKLAKLPEDHFAMIRHWIGFTRAHRDTLLHSSFTPHHATSGWTVIEAQSADERIIADYLPDTVVDLGAPDRTVYLVNASDVENVPVRFPAVPARIEAFTTTGEPAAIAAPTADGLQELIIPRAGYVKITW